MQPMTSDKVKSSSLSFPILGLRHVLEGVGVILVTLQIFTGYEVLNALLDQAEIRMEHPLQLLHHFQHQLLMLEHLA